MRVQSTSSSLTLKWEQPEDDGGCPIVSYAVYRNDGEDGPINVEVNSEFDSNIRGKPSLREVKITNDPENALGKLFSYQIEAFNVVQSSLS